MEEVRCKQYAGSTFSSLTLYNAKQAVGAFYAKRECGNQFGPESK